MKISFALILLLARVAVSAIFIYAGVDKFIEYQANIEYMTAKGMSYAPFFLYAAGIIEVVGGLSILLGYKARYGALFLALFLIPVSYIFHDFWNLSIDEEVKEQTILFFSNTAIFGGLLYIFASGAGPFSFDQESL